MSSSPEAALKIAKAANHLYVTDDPIMAAHREAMNCRNCEAWIQLGIHAFQWLMKADTGYRISLSEDPESYDPDYEKGMYECLGEWVKKGAQLRVWIGKLRQSGFNVDQADEFEVVYNEAVCLIESNEAEDGVLEMSDELIVLRDQALVEHSNGETAEFF